MKIKHLITFFSLFVMLSCQQLEPRRALNVDTLSFLKKSALRNKQYFDKEQLLIEQAIAKDTENKYLSTEMGFHYTYLSKQPESQAKPVKGNLATFSYRIENLEGQLLYDEKELGKVNYYVDNQDIVPALREGIKMMRAGEIVLFIFPSYLCYGYLGDGEKIQINQPLRMTINLLSLKSNIE